MAAIGEEAHCLKKAAGYLLACHRGQPSHLRGRIKENALRRGRFFACRPDQLAPFTVRPLTVPSLRLVWYSLPSLSCW